jgi:ParB-like nuclease domain
MTHNTSYRDGAPVGRIERAARLRWVPLTRMRVNPLAQRELRPARVSQLAAEFDVEQMGTPTVSHRGDWYYLIDGQHRIEALKSWLGAWQDQQVQCWCYQGLTEADEAEVFLKLNDTLTVRCLDRFKVAVQAGRTSEADIDRIVRALGLKISASRCSGGISATATLARVYTRGGPEVMSRALRIIRDAYGDAGLDGPVIDGIGLMCQRYDGQLPEQLAIKRLSSAHGGVSGLLSRAGHLRQQTGDAQAQCVAAAAVEAINRGTGGKKLPSWWKAEP